MACLADLERTVCSPLHPSAAGRAQDRECSPVKDRRSTTVPIIGTIRRTAGAPRGSYLRRPRCTAREALGGRSSGYAAALRTSGTCSMNLRQRGRVGVRRTPLET